MSASDQASTSSTAASPKPTRWWHFQSIYHAGWEMLLMRLGFAFIIWRNIPSIIGYTEMPKPHGIGQWIDLTFFSNPEIASVLHWILLLALLVYVSGRFALISLSFLLFMSVGTETLINSQGAIGHTSQIVSLVIFAQWLAALYAFWCQRAARKQKNGYFSTIPYGYTPTQLSMDWTRQMVAATYVVSAVTKLDASDGRWIWDAPKFGLQVMKANDMDFYNSLQPVEKSMSALAEMLMAYPWLARVVIGVGLPLELFAFLLAWNRPVAFFYALALIAFHLSVGIMMELDFLFNSLILLVFCVNLPYALMWLYRKFA